MHVPHGAIYRQLEAYLNGTGHEIRVQSVKAPQTSTGQFLRLLWEKKFY